MKFKKNQNEYKYMRFTQEDVTPLEWINSDAFNFKKWINSNTDSLHPFNIDNNIYQFTRFIVKASVLEWINKDSFYFINWLNNKGNPPPLYIDDNIIFDYVIIGAGPAGIMNAYKLSEDQSKTILLIDKGKSLEDYKDTLAYPSNQNIGTLSNSFNWQTPGIGDFGYSVSGKNTDNGDVNLSLGIGTGGGTLHFGLQYIDNIVDKSDQFYKDWKNGEKDYFSIVNGIINPYKYNYDNNNLPTKGYIDIKNKIDKTDEIDYYNNKIYSKEPIGIYQAERINVGDILNDKENVFIVNDTEINYINLNEENNIDYCTDTFGNKYYGNKFSLCLGAIQTPILLLKSGIGPNLNKDLPKVGQTLYDHAGFYSTYVKLGYEPGDSTSTKYNQDDIDYIKSLTNLGEEGFKIFDINPNDNNYENLSDTNYNKEYIKMTAIFNHTKLTDSQLIDASNGIEPTGSINLTNGINYVYNMGSYWNKPNDATNQHPGKSQYSKLSSNSYNLTSVLSGRHGPYYSRLYPGGNNNCKLIGIYKDSYSESGPDPVQIDLDFKSLEVLQHVQTRDPNLQWQTYYSIIPGLENLLILTHSQSTDISDDGKIELDSDGNTKIILDHFSNENDNNRNGTNIYNSFIKNNEILLSEELGYILSSPSPESIIDKEAFIDTLRKDYISIWHYHGSCKIGTDKSDSVVNSNYKVHEIDNLYIGDISVLPAPWGGSTSVPALITGYICGENMSI